MKNSLIITLDGHSACGKSTLAKLIAKEMGYKYIDTGAMYRAITFFFDSKNLIGNDGLIKKNAFDCLDEINIGFSELDSKGHSYITLNGDIIESKIRNLKISNLVSEISKHKPIRSKMVELQQTYASDGGLVMDGRDIGSVVFPNADVKFWVTASSETRAKRRLAEMLDNNIQVSLKDIVDNISKRDHEDQNRKESPLIKPKGAIEIDNSNLSVDQTLDLAMNHVNSLLNK